MILFDAWNLMLMQKVLIICGPTATGKSKLAISLAKTFNGELVSADSRQVYEGLDGLTGKDRSEEVPIWLYDVVAVHQEFSVAHFITLARRTIADIGTRGKLPIVVGGTGFYLRSLTTSIDTIAVPPNRELRKILNAASVETLGQRLRRVDREKWNILNESDQKNPRRLIRAIEVAMSATYIAKRKPNYDVLWIGLTSPLPVLKQRIAKRVAERFDQALSEVGGDLPPVLGADSLLSFRRGEGTKEETLAKWVQREYQYAKGQLTWFRKENGMNWFDVSDNDYEDRVTSRVGQWYTTYR